MKKRTYYLSALISSFALLTQPAFSDPTSTDDRRALLIDVTSGATGDFVYLNPADPDAQDSTYTTSGIIEEVELRLQTLGDNTPTNFDHQNYHFVAKGHHDMLIPLGFSFSGQFELRYTLFGNYMHAGGVINFAHEYANPTNDPGDKVEITSHETNAPTGTIFLRSFVSPINGNARFYWLEFNRSDAYGNTNESTVSVTLTGNSILGITNQEVEAYATASVIVPTLEYKNTKEDVHEINLDLKVNDSKVLTESSSTSFLSSSFVSTSTHNDSARFKGLSLGNDGSTAEDGKVIISNSSQSIGHSFGNDLDTSNAFLSLSDSVGNEKVSLDPNQLYAENSEFLFHSDYNFIFEAPSVKIGNSARNQTTDLEVNGDTSISGKTQTDWLNLTGTNSTISFGAINVSGCNNSIISGSDFSTGDHSVVFTGEFGAVGANYAIAIGEQSQAYGNSSAAFGYNPYADGISSFAVGSGHAYSNHSFAAGVDVDAIGENTFVFGKYNDPEAGVPATQSTSHPLKHLFVIGNGTDSSTRSNAYVLKESGESTLKNKHWNALSPLDTPTATDSNDGQALVVDGHTVLNGKVVISQAQGDISMGIFAN